MVRFKDLGSNVGGKVDTAVEKVKEVVGDFVEQSRNVAEGASFSVEDQINSIVNEVRRKTLEISLETVAKKYGLTIQEVHVRLSSAPIEKPKHIRSGVKNRKFHNTR